MQAIHTGISISCLQISRKNQRKSNNLPAVARPLEGDRQLAGLLVRGELELVLLMPRRPVVEDERLIAAADLAATVKCFWELKRLGIIKI